VGLSGWGGRRAIGVDTNLHRTIAIVAGIPAYPTWVKQPQAEPCPGSRVAQTHHTPTPNGKTPDVTREKYAVA